MSTFETVCGAIGTDFPTEYEIPRERTGTIKDQKFDDCVSKVISSIAEGVYGEEMSDGFTYGLFRKDDSEAPGMIVSVALDKWVEIGTLPKKFFDIEDEMPKIKEIVKKFPELYKYAAPYKLKGYININYNKTKKDLAIKTALTKFKHGLVAVSNKGFSGGGHCIQLTGWNDNNDTYKYKNSRGESYGDKGFHEKPKSQFDAVYLPIFDDIALPFNDVSKDDWFFNDVSDIYSSGLMNGRSSTEFAPNHTPTRAELAAFGNRLLKEFDKRNAILNKVLEEKYGD